MARYQKETTRLFAKFVRESDNEIILEVPTTAMELHDYFKTDYIYSVMKNTFSESRLEEIGNVIVVIDQRYLLTT